MKLIDKDTLVAEIEKLYDEKGAFYAADVLYNLKEYLDTLEVKEIGVDLGDPKGDKSAKYIIDTKTLEVKEVDLEHEVESYWKQCDMTWCRDAYSMTHIRSMLSDIAKNFFELGLKAQKGE